MSEQNNEINPADALIEQYGLEGVAQLQVEAHDSIYSVRDAMVKCEKFASVITALATSIEFLPEEQRTEILTQTVRKIAVEAPADDQAKKKLANPFLTTQRQTI